MLLIGLLNYLQYKEENMRKVYIDVTTRVIVQMNEGVSVDNVMTDMDYNFSFDGEEADIVDTEITNWNVKDSK